MLLKIMLGCFIVLWLPLGNALIPDTAAPKQAIRTVTSTDIAAWGFGLMMVLAVFFLCVWGMRKLSGLTVGGTEKMRMIGGLTLGLREKVILLQVGRKQLLLGVTPGRIETLLVLEGDDCLHKEESFLTATEPGFAQKLAHALKARTHA